MGSNSQHKKTAGTGDLERLDPGQSPWYQKKLVQEHLSRYRFAAGYISDKTVIDLGCGTGYGSKLLAESGAKQVIAIDVDKNAISYAKKNFPHNHITFMHSDAEITKLPSKSADVIVSFEIVEHVTHPVKYLAEVQRLLKDNGTFILSTPNLQTSFGDNPFHLKEFSLYELDKLLSMFPQKKYFGQRKVFLPIVNIYQSVFPFIPKPLRILLRFRPWESYSIHSIRKSHSIPYLYLIAVCQKKRK